MTKEELKKYLPHREPMLLVDEINIDENGVLYTLYSQTLRKAIDDVPFTDTTLADRLSTDCFWNRVTMFSAMYPPSPTLWPTWLCMAAPSISLR